MHPQSPPGTQADSQPGLRSPQAGLRSPSSLRIGVADAVDPRDMQAGSGATGSLLRALTDVVAEAVPLSGELPARVGQFARLSSAVAKLRPRDLGDVRAGIKNAHSAALLGRPTIAARRWAIGRRFAASGSLDGVVQRGSEMRLPRSAHFVTLEDSTVRQGWQSYPWPHLQGLTERDIARYSERQRKVYESAVACCCATHWVAQSIISSYGIPAERVFTVGLGQNHKAQEPAARDWSSPRYLFVGVDWQRKNGAAVLAAFARVREQHADAQLDVVGGHPPIDQPGVVPHGPLSLVKSADRERLEDLYRKATVFVMPSLHEPAGIVYVEAGNAGVPSIGTTNGGAATMIGPGGVLVDPLDQEQLLNAMLELAHPEVAQRMGELAHRHAALFTWRKVAERLIRALAIPGVDTSALAEFL
jgi:glycosyltransferase involved in cell wall biosynthesis